jgi:predicted dehydrogenase
MISFRSGPTAVLTTSFEVWATRVPSLELYGTEGTISLQEPLYSFEGVTRIRRSGTDAWEERHATPALPSERRGVGVIEMLEARARGEPPRAAADVAAHIVEVMEASLHSSEGGRWIDIDSSCAVPPPLPLDGLAARSVHLS